LVLFGFAYFWPEKKDGIGSGSRVFFILCELLSYETVKKKGSVPGSFDVLLLV
jgi:hypothetical protein